MATKKKYSKDFKLGAISLVKDQNFSQLDAAKILNINSAMLCRWIKENRVDQDCANDKLTPEQTAIKELKHQVKQLKVEKDILKKATVFFAAETHKNINYCSIKEEEEEEDESE
jgi:transposase